MQNISRRILALLLVAAMLCGLMLTTAFAEDSEDRPAPEEVSSEVSSSEASDITPDSAEETSHFEDVLADIQEDGQEEELSEALEQTADAVIEIAESLVPGSEAPEDAELSESADADAGIQTLALDGGEDVILETGGAVTVTNDPSHPWTEDGDGLKSPYLPYYPNGGTITSMALTLDVQQDGTLAFDYECSLIKVSGQYFKVFVNDEVKLEVSPTSGSSYATFTGRFEQAVSAGDTVKIDTYTLPMAGYGKISNVSFTVVCDHVNGAFQETVAPTCTEPETTTYLCVDCGKTVTVTNGAPLGHTFGDGDICTVCGAYKAWDGETLTKPDIQGGAYLIGTGEELAWFANEVNSSASNTGLNAMLTADINLGDHGWTPPSPAPSPAITTP